MHRYVYITTTLSINELANCKLILILFGFLQMCVMDIVKTRVIVSRIHALDSHPADVLEASLASTVLRSLSSHTLLVE